MLFGSVRSGIEAASIAWHPLGWRAAWLAEIEKFPSAVLAHHYPDVPNLGDITKIADAVRAGTVVAPDVLVGGTPCQAFSVAGLRGGLSDARGQLTLSYVELANAIDTDRLARGEQPAIAIWENVPGVLSSKDNAFGCFLGALAGEDCELKPAGRKWSNAGCVFGPQRTVAWRILDAQFFGVAQRRRRVFVVASARDGFDPTAVLFEFEGVRRDSPPSRSAGQGTPAGTPRSTDGGSDVDHARAGHIQAVAPCLDASFGRLQGCSGQDLNHGHGHLVTAYGGNNTSGSIDVATARNACASASGRMDFETETFLVQPAIAFNARQDPCSWSEHTGPLDTDSGTQAIAFAENSRAELRFEGGDGQRTGALKTGGGKPGQSYPVAMVGMSVRRLTPRECERLQGFPDDWTLIPYGKPSKAKLDADWLKYLLRGNPKHLTRDDITRLAADGPRYKALGNSMAVPCMAWIGRRIAAAVHAISQ